MKFVIAETLEELESDLPVVYVDSVVDNDDGTSTIIFETNKAFDELYKKEKGRKRVSKKGLGNFILELFEKGL